MPWVCEQRATASKRSRIQVWRTSAAMPLWMRYRLDLIAGTCWFTSLCRMDFPSPMQ
jgi:hypothetical protein